MTNAYAASVSLVWDASTSAAVIGYRLHQGTASHTYSTNVDVGNQTAYTVLNVNSGQTYYFAVTAYDAQGNQSAFSNEVTYTVPLAAPVANFNASPTSGTPPLTVAFTDTSTGTITTWLWDFGDGTTSAAQHPRHPYATAGTYTVRLTVRNTDSSNTLTRSNLIIVSTTTTAPPVANFTGTPTTGVVPLTVAFTNTTTGNATSWLWNFGDGTTSTAQHPSYTYTTAGAYTVTLTATGPGGSDAERKVDYVTATVLPPVANFSATPTTGPAPLAVVFTNTTTGSATTWAWDFGDGSTSTAQHPSHTYATAGTYSVRLTVGGAHGTNTLTRSNVITVSAPLGLVAAYGFENGSGTTLTDVSGAGNHGTIFEATWTTQGRFGQALTFDGVNDWVTIAATPALDLTTSMTLEAWVYPMAGMIGWHTVLLKERARQLSYALYASGDTETPVGELMIGSAYQTTRGPDALQPNTWSHLAVTRDSTTLRLYVNGTLVSSQAVSGPLALSTNPLRLGGNSTWGEYFAGRIDEVRMYNRTLTATEIQADMQTPVIPPLAPPVANFTATPTTGPVPLAVTFTDTTAGTATSWTWDFGNGSSSTAQHPNYTYTTAGVYTVRLTTTGPGGSHTVTKTNHITVSAPPGSTGLVAAYSFENGSGTTLTDISGMGNHGTIAGATWSTNGHFGRALSFDGSNDWVTIADAPSLDLTTGMTLEAWVYPTGLNGWGTVLMKQQPDQLVYALYANNDTNRPSGHAFIGSDIDTQGLAALPLNAWSHLATTYDGTRVRFYVNGTLASSRAVSGALQTSNNPLRLGGNGVWGEYFQGRIDEVRIYNRALTATAIQADMQTSVASPAAALATNLTGASMTGRALSSVISGNTPSSTITRGAWHVGDGASSPGQHLSHTVTNTHARSLTSSLMEVGEVQVEHVWKTVTLRQPFSAPIVVANALSRNDDAPATVQIRHVTPSGFEIRVEAWHALERPHAAETVGYLVLERGRHIIDGVQIEAGSIPTNLTQSFVPVAFSRPFAMPPVVLTALVSTAEPRTVTTWLRRVTAADFQVRMQEQDTHAASAATETLTYIALEPAVGTLGHLHFEVQSTAQVTTDVFRTIPFTVPFMTPPIFLAAIQTTFGADPGVVRWAKRDVFGIDVQFPAPQSRAVVMTRTAEILGYVAFAPTDSHLPTDGDGLTNASELEQDGTKADDPTPRP